MRRSRDEVIDLCFFYGVGMCVLLAVLYVIAVGR